MDTHEKTDRLRARLEKIERVKRLLELLPKLAEPALNDSLQLRQRCLEAAGSKQGESIMRLLRESARRMKQIQERSESAQHGMNKAERMLAEAFSSLKKVAENLEDTSIDELLDSALTRIEASQTELQKQLFELHALAVELDRKLKIASRVITVFDSNIILC